MRNKVFGGIGIIWGGLILLHWFASPALGGASAYQAGQTAGAIFGAAMLAAGLYYFFKKPKQA